jgi:hypothetical protein
MSKETPFLHSRGGVMRSSSLLMVIVIGCSGVAVAALAAAPVAAPAAASDWHATVREFAAKHFKNPAWGYSHCMRDYALARELAAADHVTLDDDVLFAAAYLHDMAAFKPWENEKLDHSESSTPSSEARASRWRRSMRCAARFAPTCTIGIRWVPKPCTCTMPMLSIGWAPSAWRGSWRSSIRTVATPMAPRR